MSEENLAKEVKIPVVTSPNLYSDKVITVQINDRIDDSTMKSVHDAINKAFEHNNKIKIAMENHEKEVEFDKLNNPDAKPKFVSFDTKIERINLVINTYGGYVHSMLEVVELMKSSPIPIDTYCFGNAISAGFFIFIHGKNRYASSRSTFMHHSMITGYYGNVNDMMNYCENHLKVFHKKIQNAVASKTKLTVERQDERGRDDWYMFSDEAYENGVIDYVIAD